METQSQEHLKRAGEITSLRNKWRECWWKRVVVWFSEVSVVFDLRKILYPPWGLVAPSVKWDASTWCHPPHWVVDMIPWMTHIKSVLMKKEVTPWSSEMQIPREVKLVTKVLNQRRKMKGATGTAPPTWRHRNTDHCLQVLEFFLKKLKYGF